MSKEEFSAEEIDEYLYEEYLYFEYKDKLEEANKEIENLKNQLQQKENIIKEVRECVETAISEDYYAGEIYKIKELLDKDNNEKI